MGQILDQVQTISMRVQKELILLHKSDVTHPTGTVKWINKIGWTSSYFHVSGLYVICLWNILSVGLFCDAILTVTLVGHVNAYI